MSQTPEPTLPTLFQNCLPSVILQNGQMDMVALQKCINTIEATSCSDITKMLPTDPKQLATIADSLRTLSTFYTVNATDLDRVIQVIVHKLDILNCLIDNCNTKLNYTGKDIVPTIDMNAIKSSIANGLGSQYVNATPAPWSPAEIKQDASSPFGMVSIVIIVILIIIIIFLATGKK